VTLASLPSLDAGEVPVVTAAQMAEVDRIAIDELSIPLAALMENASRQIAAATRLLLGGIAGRRVAAIAGTGSNGGDALGAVRHLLGWGATVVAYLAAPQRLRPVPRLQYEMLGKLGVPLYETTALEQRALVHQLREHDAIIDGLLGYSTTGAPRGEIARLIQAIFASARPGAVVAVDLPSGLHPDSGENLSATPIGTVPAALTVTLALPKRGLVREIARRWVGELVLADIGIPAKAYAGMAIDAGSVYARGDLLRIIR